MFRGHSASVKQSRQTHRIPPVGIDPFAGLARINDGVAQRRESGALRRPGSLSVPGPDSGSKMRCALLSPAPPSRRSARPPVPPRRPPLRRNDRSTRRRGAFRRQTATRPPLAPVRMGAGRWIGMMDGSRGGDPAAWAREIVGITSSYSSGSFDAAPAVSCVSVRKGDNADLCRGNSSSLPASIDDTNQSAARSKPLISDLVLCVSAARR